MAVYVDDMFAPYGRMKMCHMLADSDEELHAMAAQIGVARRWHQAPPRHDSHYDIAMSKREEALRLGAVAITLRQAAAMNLRRRATGTLGSPEDALEWAANYRSVRRAAAAVAREREELSAVPAPAAD
ncbi:hypothetical protein D3C71_19480 [compost metagenome]